ncbi:TetR/AcrR family transcriptional regulator [Variovorax ginsengisoli]|uniref:AcrR family transcriptional regulator n=1 Tax=Variovorax ginsengisoli TaxID=363844 RepID=A0ABT9SCH8_9BURK|nr:TetR/AcrR family transcriptional regulator [Variovorax ginsengisoli]MDP9901087.1 AcrR family transcriptional regulator [Variovorax ginsengisoli]
MSFRPSRPEVLSRARTQEDKAKVKEAFIAAGRQLFADENPATVSLRRIAAAAGYAPGSIYQYFANQQDLFFQVRAHDMRASTEHLREQVARVRSPVKRVLQLFIGTADYWLAHMDAFLMIFPAPGADRSMGVGSAGVPFGQSDAAQDSLQLYYDVVDGYFQTLAHPPANARLAADALIAAVHGMIVFPCMTRTMDWSDTRAMVKHLVHAVVADWGKAGEAA